jgi:hypothetical protein
LAKLQQSLRLFRGIREMLCEYGLALVTHSLVHRRATTRFLDENCK